MQTKLSDANVTPKKEVNIAEELAKKQREISVAEFFTKNRHLLGFDNPRKSLLTSIKEAVDNSLDATEEAKTLPDIIVEVKEIAEDRYKIAVEDNGPGIVKEQVPRVFGKLLYGSKFHRYRQSRGQQGIGISAVNLFSQLTTGKPMLILSKIGKNRPANYLELQLNTKTNEPEIIKQEVREWEKDHGVRVEFEIEAKYVGGKQSVDEYLKNTAIANPHAQIKYKAPDADWIEFPRAVTKLPKEPKEIQPHPYGIELGMLITKLKDTKARTLKSFLETEFSRVSSNVAKEICEKAKLEENLRPEKVERQQAEQIMAAIKITKIMAPPTDCLSPIGEDALLKGLKKEVDAEFFAAVTRPPAVYRGNPFQIEVAIAYGGKQPADDLIRLIRFANRVPLLYQQSACATTKAVMATAWKNYGISQSRGALPAGPVILVVHMASVWVPFTSESKEAMASYPEIMHEMKLAIQEVGRKVASYIRKTVRAREQLERVNLFEKYIPELASALSSLSGAKKTELEEELRKTLKKGLKDLLAQAQQIGEKETKSKEKE